MDIEKSRCGFYCITFVDEKGMTSRRVQNIFSKCGKVVRVTRKYRRVFIWYEKKEAAIKALSEFGSLYDLTPAINSEIRKDNVSKSPTEFMSQNSIDGGDSFELGMSWKSSNTEIEREISETEIVDQSLSLILGNLPKNFHAEDVMRLVEEVKPLCLTNVEETIILNLKFCEIILDSTESLSYLINKLDGFVICGEKLIAVGKAELMSNLDN